MPGSPHSQSVFVPGRLFFCLGYCKITKKLSFCDVINYKFYLL
ncbi:hypothetical protein ANACOL_04109 [Anaerotruncus colihominis DSM 17241]|uniref:Uncharacterized protein n=1 Tax=Anaerotruncus colihominis DSM 17241 TaxID=445972 RepID=B0PH87_9FIRM|nr:hypothetical protein ANACOL_04109 [Anaerotruncus colihominis DSM 17241]